MIEFSSEGYVPLPLEDRNQLPIRKLADRKGINRQLFSYQQTFIPSLRWIYGPFHLPPPSTERVVLAAAH